MVRSLARIIGDLALPPRCPGCGDPVGADGRFCATCWGTLRFIGPPWCAACNVPLAFDAGPDTRCEDCVVSPPRHRGVRAAVVYGDIARRLALKLKYGGRIGVANTMAALMARHVPGDADLMVPVPLHRWRLWSRGYNQALLIGRALTRRGAPVCEVAILVRTRSTPILRGMSRGDRSRAVANAFAVTPAGRARIAGRHVILVDDVHTSGATVGACTAVLLDAGAAGVTVVCWARVVSGTD